MTMISDPRLEHAILQRAGHEPPVTPEDLTQTTTIVVKRARGLDDLKKLPNLTVVVLIGCDPVHPGELAGLPSLSLLQIEHCQFSDLTGLADLPIVDLEIRCNFVRDLTPLLDWPHLARLDVTGNPLSDHSRHEVLPALREKGCKVLHSQEQEWSLTVRMQENGMPFGYYSDPDSGFRLSAPGLAVTSTPDVGQPAVAPETLERLLRHDPEQIRRLFDREP